MTIEQIADELEALAGRIRGDVTGRPLPAGLSQKSLTASDLAKESGLHVKAVRRYANAGVIPGRNHGGRIGWVFDRDRAMRALTLKFGNAAEKELARK